MQIQNEYIEFSVKIIFAAFFSGVIGLERGMHGRAAGFRTHVLVGIGTAVFTIISIQFASMSPINPENAVTSPDPGRIAAQIISGIGFLGAGAILKFGANIHGLTTAACLWLVAAIGMACGSGSYGLALITTVMAIISLTGLNLLDHLIPHHSYRTLHLVVSGGTNTSTIISKIKQKKVKISSVSFVEDFQNDTITVTLDIRLFHTGLTDKFFYQIKKDILDLGLPVLSLRWQK
ncbi:MAG: MgtC/SapB family protein [Fibrobacteria bacterium]|nr:MgtC/SapB family protein [Fibrobacteria bacterium]